MGKKEKKIDDFTKGKKPSAILARYFQLLLGKSDLGIRILKLEKRVKALEERRATNKRRDEK